VCATVVWSASAKRSLIYSTTFSQEKNDTQQKANNDKNTNY